MASKCPIVVSVSGPVEGVPDVMSALMTAFVHTCQTGGIDPIAALEYTVKQLRASADPTAQPVETSASVVFPSPGGVS